MAERPATSPPMAAARKRRLILCFDGTWNTPESHTNVSRLYAAVADLHSGCEEQLKFYDTGVGTEFGSIIRGGAAGVGLSKNILQGYCWLIRQYECAPGATRIADGETFDDGDEIFLFGFSRGAFTARSLGGLINRCGILKRDAVEREARGAATQSEASLIDTDLVKQAWAMYRDKSKKRDSGDVSAFRTAHSWNVTIRMVGVWDTVGALGIPETLPIPDALRQLYSFHDTSLGQVIEHAYHAVAIDEHREDYCVALWDKKHHDAQVVEQRWFPGAHANVGGGYEDDLLPDPPLRWLAERARLLEVKFIDMGAAARGEKRSTENLPPSFDLIGNEYLSPVRDSYREFGLGLYAPYVLATSTLKGQPHGRFYRPMLVNGVEETIDVTANLKWSADATYRPANLALAGRFLGPGGGGPP